VDLARDWRREAETPSPALLELQKASPAIPARPARPLTQALTRALDVSCALVLLIVTAPLLATAAAVVLLSSGRPIFFGHVRVGKGGCLFRCWKFRTMRADAEARLETDAELRRRYLANGFKLPTADDPRVLPRGRWLRRLYLDELPQLWNVLRGEMALIGPRPVVPSEIDLFGEHAPALLAHRPGLFGEWTSRGRDRPPYPERVRVEMQWVDDPSLARGARILARSVGAVLRGQGEGA
jgi:exopolysaccharide production protein ExoY